MGAAELSYICSCPAKLGDLNERGVTLREGQTLETLYEERVPLHEQYAHITMDCERLSIREIVEEIVRKVR